MSTNARKQLRVLARRIDHEAIQLRKRAVKLHERATHLRQQAKVLTQAEAQKLLDEQQPVSP